MIHFDKYNKLFVYIKHVLNFKVYPLKGWEGVFQFSTGTLKEFIVKDKQEIIKRVA